MSPPADAELVEKVPLDKNGNFKVATARAWDYVPVFTEPDGVPRGKVTTFAMKSEVSKFYPGDSGAYSRDV